MAIAMKPGFIHLKLFTIQITDLLTALRRQKEISCVCGDVWDVKQHLDFLSNFKIR